MTISLAAHQEQFVRRLVKGGRFNNASEVVRDALRALEEKEAAYLNPPPLPPGTLERIYRRETKAEKRLIEAAAKASVTPEEAE